MQSSQAQSAVKHEPLPWGDHYSGTAEALIAAGVITADQLPARSCATYYAGALIVGKKPAKDENFLRITRASAKRVTVWKGISSGEVKRRADAERERNEAERHRAREQSEAAFNSNPENLRGQVELSLRLAESIIRDHAPGCDGEGAARKGQLDCRFDGEGVDVALAHLREVQIWLENTGISQVRKSVRPPVSAARSDKAFQAFLQAQCLGGGEHA